MMNNGFGNNLNHACLCVARRQVADALCPVQSAPTRYRRLGVFRRPKKICLISVLKCDTLKSQNLYFRKIFSPRQRRKRVRVVSERLEQSRTTSLFDHRSLDRR